VDLDQIRKVTITALFSDDSLLDQIVLKGGNALSLIYGISSRSSLDLDFSIEGDFEDVEETKASIFKALKDRFSSVGLIVFDETFEPKPARPDENQNERWGGYQLIFKLIEMDKHAAMREDVDALRRQALVVGPHQQRKFCVDFSKFEYCAGKKETELDHYTIYVYTESMLAIEKLRAICQQMPEYKLRRNPCPRARDFYDIHLIIAQVGIDLSSPENLELIPPVFAAKDVPLRLIAKIPEQREFHRPDWPAVQTSVRGKLEGFDFYFDFVVEQTGLLKTLWIK